MSTRVYAEAVIGRENELRAIDDFLEQVSGGPVALILEGEAGIGKTALWHEAVDRARQRGVRVLVARPAEAERDLSFAGLGDLLAPLRDDISGLPDPQRHALRVALLLEDPVVAPPDRRAVSLAVLALLGRIASETPLLVAVDDVQWLDASSAALLTFAARRVNAEPIGFLLSRRVGDGTRGPELLPTLDRAMVMHVGPLGFSATVELLRRAGLVFPRPTMRSLHATSGGNPLFALELGRALDRGGDGTPLGGDLPVPSSLERLVSARIERLEPDVREVLLFASAAAEPTRSLLASVARISDELLKRAADAGVLEPAVVESEGEQVRFSHPLFAAATYATAPRGHRREIHRRLAEVVGAPEERARHLALGAEGPDESVAAALERAAKSAASRGAPESAVGLAALAVERTPPKAVADRNRRRFLVAHTLNAAGDWGRAEQELRDLIAQLSPGPMRAEALILCGWVIAPREGVALSSEAVAEAVDDPGIEARARLARGIQLFALGDLRGAGADVHAALKLARSTDDPMLLAPALAGAIRADTFAGRPVAERKLAEALAAEERIGSLPFPFTPTREVGRYLMFRDRFAEARDSLGLYRRRAIEHGQANEHATGCFELARLECRAGRFGIAAHLAQEGFGITEVGGGQSLSALLWVRALAAMYLGDVGIACRDAEKGVELSRAIGDETYPPAHSCVLGLLELSLGDYAAASRHLRSIWDLLVDQGYGEPSIYPVLPNAVEALIGIGELEEAERQLEQLEERGQALDSAWALSQASRCRALLAAARGDLNRALGHVDDALAAHERLPDPFERGRTLLVRGSLLRRLQKRREARDVLQRTLASFEELETPLWAEKARNELARLGGRPGQSWQLTETEREIAELVAAGKSNHEVAGTLHVSPKTVEWNLSKIYKKLRVRSRTELTAKLARRD